MNVLGFGDELHFLFFSHIMLLKCKLIRLKRTAVNNQQLVLFELNFLWRIRIQYRDASTAIV